jgi:hypothetical protein
MAGASLAAVVDVIPIESFVELLYISKRHPSGDKCCVP